MKFIIFSIQSKIISHARIPWWSSSKESTCQCRGHRFAPWSKMISYAVGQLNLCVTTTETALWSPMLQLLKPAHLQFTPLSLSLCNSLKTFLGWVLLILLDLLHWVSPLANSSKYTCNVKIEFLTTEKVGVKVGK